jgi:tetratricopeptide (TPR) repeat protein
MTRKALALCLFALAAVAGNAFAVTEGRMAGKVTDAVTKKPVPNVTITFVATERRTLKQTFKTDKDGKYQILMLDGTIPYMVTFEAPGYTPYGEKIKLKIGGEVNLKDVELQPAGATPTAAAPGAARTTVDTNVVAYNEGAKLFNEGKVPEAIAKFKEVLKARPEMIAAWEALARADLRAKDYAGAIESANKALEIAPDETDMHAILYEAYMATGDKVKAAEAKKKMPADAGTIFNDAVKLLNAGKDTEAEPLLRQAIQANDKFGPAYYELGMVYIRLNKLAEAKQNLEKYLEIEPNGKEAATVKETLKYLK